MAPVRIDYTHFSPDIVEFIESLTTHQVRYVIVGGQAVVLHGHVRLTGAVDFFFAIDAPNIKRLYQALLDFWDGNIPGVDRPEELQTPSLILQFGQPPNRIDLINEVDGVEFEEAWNSQVEAILATPRRELPLHYMGVDELIKNKQAAGRPKDLDDLKYLKGTEDR